MATLALVDDHGIFRDSLTGTLHKTGHEVIIDAANGEEFIEKLRPSCLPDIVLLDINMPVKDGYATAQWIKQNYPGIKILVLSMFGDESRIVRMMLCGAHGYVAKESNIDELRTAINAILTKGYYYSEHIGGCLMQVLNTAHNDSSILKTLINLTPREEEFLKLSCTEMTYKEIAAEMKIGERTIDTYREGLFEKLNVKSRMGLMAYAVKHSLVSF